MKFWIFVLGIFIFSAKFVYAEVVITEIMYDLEGSDADREWIEIQNNGSDVDLTNWKFFENGTNHGLALSQGNALIPQNGFAIIADDPEKFLIDWPGFAGTLFDSSFSLSNSGETIVLRDLELADIDSVAYSSDWGANGDGNSLQKINNQWISALPTPGDGSSNSSLNSGGQSPSENNNAQSLESISQNISEPSKAPFSAYAGADKYVLAGGEVYFEGLAYGISEDLMPKARFLWNFGDGMIGEGKNIKHTFYYPGNYVVNLNVSFGAYTSFDSMKINVSPADITVSEIKPGAYLEIKNDSTKISDVSGFGIAINDYKIFNFPKDTLFSPNSFLTLDTSTLGFEIFPAGEIKILYPNGKILFSSKYDSGVLSEKESINFDGEKWVKLEATPGAKNTPTPSPTKVVGGTPPYKGGETKTSKIVSPPLQGGIGGGSGEASVINSQAGASLWSEIKWLVFGLGGGIFAGSGYLFLKRHFKPVSAL